MQRYFAKEKQEGTFILNENDWYHIKTVMRFKEDDLIEVVFEHHVYECCLQSVNQKMAIIPRKELENNTEFPSEIVFIIPLLKEVKMDFILQKCTELGVSKIIPMAMKHSVIKLDPAKEQKRIMRWMRICKEASEQSKRVSIPIITEVMNWSDLTDNSGLNLICSTRENSKNLKSFLHSPKKYDRITLVIGPEGGLAKEEEENLVAKGFQPLSLGSRILRVETVPLFLLSAINYEYME